LDSFFKPKASTVSVANVNSNKKKAEPLRNNSGKKGKKN
jgi:hypothetical protein